MNHQGIAQTSDRDGASSFGINSSFYEKWKFYPTKLEKISLEERKNIINYLDEEYNGKLTWTKNLKSYEWIYI